MASPCRAARTARWLGRVNSREAATLIWLGLLLALCLRTPDVRSAVSNVARSFATAKIAVPLAAYVALLGGCVVAAARLGMWTSELATPTAFSFMLTGMVLFFNIAKAGQEDRYFRKIVVKTVSLAVFIEVFVGLETFNILFELVLQPVVALLVCLPIVAASEPRLQPVERAAEGLLGAIGVAMLVLTAAALWRDRASLDSGELVQQFALPIWLTLVTIPFLYVLSLYAEYELAFIRMKIGNDMRRPGWRARIAAILELRSDLRLLHRVTNYWGGRTARAPSLAAARRELREFRADIEQKDEAEREASDRLIRNEGLPGSDADGRRYDRREFKETVDALTWLATCHMGWYQRENRYRADLLTVLDDLERQGLPGDHGIRMHVRGDGQAWYAYRRTITGWVFGIGAAGPPPDQRFYEGADVPSGFPGEHALWGQQPHERSLNW